MFVQGRFDGAFRRKSRRAAIGASLELVVEGSSPKVLMDLGKTRDCTDSYEAEFEAASALVAECVQLYVKICLAATCET